MYEAFYGLKEKPFNLNPDPDYLFMSRGHENAYLHLEYAILENKGFVVITGEIGSGKTTLINYLLRKIPQDILVGIINNTLVQPVQFLKMICQEYELPVEEEDKTIMLTHFYNFLLEQYGKRQRVVLIIDEAQNLPDITIEEIRMLSNLESEKHHLIQIILVGQPQLREKLQQKNLEQFVQRVTVYTHLDALDKVEVNDYITHRLTVAGASDLNIFDEDALKAIYKHSLGIPRMINILCDTALVYGYADEHKVIGREMIENVAEARKISGTLQQEQEKALIPELKEKATEDTALPSLLENRMRIVEERVTELGAELKQLTQDMEKLSTGKDERDRIIIQLFKMLKKNMENRARLMMDVIRLKGQLSIGDKLKDSEKQSKSK